MLTRPEDVVDLWHDENLASLGYAPNFGKEIGTARRQMVREDWPELGEMLDKLPPKSVRSVVELVEHKEQTIIDIPWYGVIIIGTVIFVAGMVVQKFVVGS